MLLLARSVMSNPLSACDESAITATLNWDVGEEAGPGITGGEIGQTDAFALAIHIVPVAGV